MRSRVSHPGVNGYTFKRWRTSFEFLTHWARFHMDLGSTLHTSTCLKPLWSSHKNIYTKQSKPLFATRIFCKSYQVSDYHIRRGTCNCDTEFKVKIQETVLNVSPNGYFILSPFTEPVFMHRRILPYYLEFDGKRR